VEERVVALLRFDVAAESRYSPAEFEVRFDMEEGAGLRGLRLKGRMDRLEVGPDGSLFLVDYKSGRDVRGPRFAKDGALQLPLYLLALQALRPGAVVGGAYYPLAGGRPRGMVRETGAEYLGSWAPSTARVNEETFHGELDACLELARQAAAGIRGGVVPASPRAGRCPPWCRLQPVCRGPLQGGG
jgi:RecB family exonuclease